MLKKLDFLNKLAAIKPVELANPQTTKEEAMRLCVDIMRILAECEPYKVGLKSSDYAIVCDILKDIGCVKIDKLKLVHPDFISNNPTIDKAQKSPDDLSFPLSVINNLLSADSGSFVYVIEKSFGKNNWCDTWLQNHENKAKTEEETM